MSLGPPSESPMDPRGPLSLEGAGVLIVDEDPAFQLGLKTFLREYVGFSPVYVANNGREALRILREEPCIELVTLDYRMPELDGLGVLDRLREDPPRPLAVVMITGYPSERLEEEFHAHLSPMLRTEHFVAKPVDFGALEPVLLRAYESLKTKPLVPEPPLGSGTESPALNAAVAEAVGAPAPAFLAETREALESLEESMDARMVAMQRKLIDVEARLDLLAGRTPSLMGRFWLRVLGWIFAAALGFLAYQMGWFAEAGGWIERTLLAVPPDGGPGRGGPGK